VKLMPGGLVETEFVAQALQVAHAHRLPVLLSSTTRIALRNLATVGLLTEAEAATLTEADRLWRAILAHLRLTVGRWGEETLPEAVAGGLLAAVGKQMAEPPVDQAGLRTQMRAMAEAVRAVFLRRIGLPETQ
jgi:glutamate-ammonia-ligase adenylyltransferase